jgi:hypothetical protein
MVQLMQRGDTMRHDATLLINLALKRIWTLFWSLFRKVYIFYNVFLSGSFVSRPSRETAPAPAKFLESFVDWSFAHLPRYAFRMVQRGPTTHKKHYICSYMQLYVAICICKLYLNIRITSYYRIYISLSGQMKRNDTGDVKACPDLTWELSGNCCTMLSDMSKKLEFLVSAFPPIRGPRNMMEQWTAFPYSVVVFASRVTSCSFPLTLMYQSVEQRSAQCLGHPGHGEYDTWTWILKPERPKQVENNSALKRFYHNYIVL